MQVLATQFTHETVVPLLASRLDSPIPGCHHATTIEYKHTTGATVCTIGYEIDMTKVNIGLRQASRLCQLSPNDRSAFIAEGLPIILDSARGFWNASQQLTVAPREADVLTGFAEEEAAKILILIDIIRCPPRLLSTRISVMLGWFYDHLARMLYAKAATWKPMHVTQLREYIDNSRKAHYLDGFAGEYIYPNSEIFNRKASSMLISLQMRTQCPSGPNP